MKKTAKKNTAKRSSTEFRPFRVLFLIIVVSVTCLVLLAALGANS